MPTVLYSRRKIDMIIEEENSMCSLDGEGYGIGDDGYSSGHDIAYGFNSNNGSGIGYSDGSGIGIGFGCGTGFEDATGHDY